MAKFNTDTCAHEENSLPVFQESSAHFWQTTASARALQAFLDSAAVTLMVRQTVSHIVVSLANRAGPKVMSGIWRPQGGLPPRAMDQLALESGLWGNGAQARELLYLTFHLRCSPVVVQQDIDEAGPLW